LTIQQILLKYWGYSSFRPLQEEIIQSVLDGNDTLALLPTGGGKSVTFQVPALAREGICLVISPLISLMKDQVDGLVKRGIPAAAIYSGMYAGEMDLVFNKCRYGDLKLLYVSPERLTTDKMKDAIHRMKISLVAVDEAHCISQWGYDFRPPYLEIAAIRAMLPGVPFLALTATATGRVVTDICEKLNFKPGNVFRQSFERKNLTYYVFKEEDKNRRILNILRKVKGPGIIYVRNRRHTKEYADFLIKKGIAAIHYHAGLDPKVREKNQNAWMKEEKRVIVATNAFGMGIDKPNVRVVIHADLPDSLEAYFQEAGRAGRDEKRSFAVLLIEKADILDAGHNLVLAYPELEVIRNIYRALGNYFQIPLGSGRDSGYDFEITDFCTHFDFNQATVFNALKFLEKQGFFVLTDAVYNPSRVFMKADKETLYRFQVENEYYDPFIKTLLRSYSGIFTEFVKIHEAELAKRTQLDVIKVKEMLARLSKLEILEYQPGGDKPRIIFTENRINENDLFISPEFYKIRKKEAEIRLQAVISYVEGTGRCRSQSLLSYFGETTSRRCGKCDVCIERNKIELSDLEFELVLNVIKPFLKTGPCSLEDLAFSASPLHEDNVIKVIQWLLDNDKITMDESQRFYWK
jgi:ATP-dependent DNA helicase RecQ